MNKAWVSAPSQKVEYQGSNSQKYHDSQDYYHFNAGLLIIFIYIILLFLNCEALFPSQIVNIKEDKQGNETPLKHEVK